ncbi:MAG: response regulator [Planctomycetes bacterium]|nr:response regulator [Planctomycetota bacterium]
MSDAKTRILVVDDEPDTCENLRDIFTEMGYEADIAFNGSDAMELVARQHYDVALLDLKMPGMDGLELYRRIRKVSAGTVAIVVTAYASSSTADSVLEAGAWRMLSKPVNFQQLLTAVGEAANQPLVLLVDDDSELCDSLWDLFREQGYRVCLAHDVDAAARQLERCGHQVVLIDWKLPRGTGADVLSLVRKQSPRARTILITGHRGEWEERVQNALQQGADAVCYKPFEMSRLLETVRQLSRPSSS